MSCTCASRIGESFPTFDKKFKAIEYVEEGMRVLAPVREVARHLIPDVVSVERGTSCGIWCTVAVAAGTHARVVNDKRGVDRWVHISSLCVLR